MTPEQLKLVLGIAERNYKKYHITADSMVLQELAAMRSEVKQLQSSVNAMVEECDDMDVSEDETDQAVDTGNGPCSDVSVDTKESEITIPHKRGSAHCNKRGRKIQQYSPDGKDLIKTWGRMSDVVRDRELSSTGVFGKYSIDYASKKRTLFKGFRWHFVPKHTKPDKSFDIGATVARDNKPNLSSVVRLSEDLKSIDAAYASRADVAKELELADPSTVVRAINAHRLLRDRRYMSVDECSSDMIEQFVSSGGVIPHHLQNHTAAKALPINKLDADSGEVLETFKTFSEVMSMYKLSRTTLLKAINGNLVERTFRWNYAATSM